MIHQNCQFLDHLSLCDNIALPLKLARQTHNADDMDIAHLMSWVGLTARQDAYPPELSGGERQRAALARALITNPDVIFADEPTGNIDWDMSMTVLDYLVQMHQAGKTILIATHDLGLVRAAKQMTVARVLRINQGSLEIAGTDL
jgi:cell division transport system ATP-binding protein